MNRVTVEWRPDWTVRDYVDFVPGRPLVGGFVALASGDLNTTGSLDRLHNLDTTITRDRAAQSRLLVEGSRGETTAVIFTT